MRASRSDGRRWARRRLAAGLGAAVLAAATAGHARPYAVEDLVQQESFGRAAFDPTGRWLVFERRGPHGEAPSFAYEPRSEAVEGRLRVVDLDHPGPPRALLSGDPMGLTLGPFSPDGRRLAVYGLSDGAWRLGVVTLASGAVTWFDLTPEFPATGRTAQWLSADSLLAIARPHGSLPRPLRVGGEALAVLPGRWAETARGGVAVTVVGSGRFRDARPRPDPSSLVRVDVRSGAISTLARGELEDLEISPDRARVAFVLSAEDIALRADRPVQGDWGVATQRQRLAIVTLATGQVVSPCPAWDLAGELLSWSPSGRQLLVFARRDETPWSAGTVLRVTDSGVFPVELGEARPVLRSRPEVARAVWLGETPVVYARAPDGRLDWIASDRRKTVALTARFKLAPDALQPAGRALLGFADGRAWRLTVESARTLGGAEVLGVASRPWVRLEQRLTINPAEVRPTLIARQGTDGQAAGVILTETGGTSTIGLPQPDSRVIAYDTTRRAVVSVASDLHGVERLSLSVADGGAFDLGAVNARLADVEPPRVLEVRHAGSDGTPLRSWLYLPAVRTRSAPPPLVVVPYPGARYPAPQTPADLNQPYQTPSVLALVGAGYAVLTPSLPPSPGAEPVDGLAAKVLAVVDAAAVQHPGAFDPDRLALWGHSYGGYGTLAILTQTERFRVAIETAGPVDLVGLWGAFQPSWRIDAAQGLSVSWSAGWTESSQGAMGAPPWADAGRYVRNSPIFQADRIRTPLMLVAGDQDDVALSQAEEMFSALYRQDRDALLLTYWGEDHIIRSPGNVRDLYRRAFAWLARHL